MDFKIEYTWDGFPVKHEPVFVRLNPGDGGVVMEVSAPFFNDPPAPLGEPGKPFNELWDYEVVEAFFLNDITEQYLEVELCPHGQHLVLLLSGRRNVWKQELALSFRVSREETKWEGKAYLPWSYFPPKVTKFNSFAIHGSKDKRNYEALYPVPQHELQQGQKPDFWTIEFTAWENLPVLHRLVSLKFKSGIQGLLMEVNAFFDDLPTPPEYADQPRDGPWEYEGETFLFRVPKLIEIESTCYIWGALLPYLLLLSEFTDTSCYLSEKLKVQWHGELGSKLCDLE